MRSFSAGTLLWIDDNFEKDVDAPEQDELDRWKKTFGEVENRVYRLLGLQLEVATNRDMAFDLIDELCRPEHAHRFVVAVVDLRIPPRHGERINKACGLAVAERLLKLGIPFFFLSSSTENAARRDLKERGLDRVPYFRKSDADGTPSMMPEHLARQILYTFRNNITWLDLGPVLNRVEAGFGNLLNRFEHVQYFPFFSIFRDFVERWEARSGRPNPQCCVLRANAENSDTLIAQCVHVVLAGRSFRRNPTLCWIDSERHAPLGEALASVDMADPANVVVVRLHGRTPGAECDFLRNLLSHSRGAQLFVIVPQDDSSDPMLEILASVQDVAYDDVPSIRDKDNAGREDLIRRSAQFAFQRQQIVGVDGAKHHLHPVFIEHPELLVDPISWTFINEAHGVSEDFNDPAEVIAALKQSASELQHWPPSALLALIEGAPPPDGSLLRPAFGVFKNLNERHKEWYQRGFRNWLTESWRVPFNALRSRDLQVAGAHQTDWENHCVRVAYALADQFATIGVETDDPGVARAAAFLTHPAIRKVLDHAPDVADWDGIESLRWPHAEFPMPTALSRLLKASGRYLWVQTDLLDRATVLKSGRRALDRVDARAERTSQKLDWLAGASIQLPTGWGSAASTVLEILNSRNLARAWADDEARTRYWRSLYAVVANATPVAFLYHRLASRTPPALTDEDVKDLSKNQFAGKLMGIVRGGRAKRLPALFRIKDAPDARWAAQISELRDYVAFFNSFRAFPAHEPGSPDILKALDELLTKFDALNEDDALTANSLHTVLMQQSAFWDGRFFHKDFEPRTPRSNILAHGAMRGTNGDILIAALDGAERLRFALRPMLHFDGYHLLALMQDLRNVYKGLPPPPEHLDVVEHMLELFVFGFEGLVAQLKWLMIASGRDDLAQAINTPSIEAVAPNVRVEGLERAFAVEQNDHGSMVFSLGIPGKDSSNRLAFDDGHGSLRFAQAQPAMKT